MDNKISLWEKIFSKPVYKFILFLISYILAVAIALIINNANLEDFYKLFIVGVIAFPGGFVWLIHSSQHPGAEYINWLYSIGWLTYLIITLCAVVIQNRRTSKILYFIFVVLLILNIYGCIAPLQLTEY